FVWPMQFVSDSSLTRAIADLRKALGRDRKIIQTLSGVGYRFTEEAVPVRNDSTVDIESLYPTTESLARLIHLLGVFPFVSSGIPDEAVGIHCAETLTSELGISAQVPVVSISQILERL